MQEELEPLVPAFTGIRSTPSSADTAVWLNPVSRGWTGRFALIWLGFWMANLVPLQLLLPSQLAGIDPANKVRDFAILNAVSGAVALVALPVCGALPDRSQDPFGSMTSCRTRGCPELPVPAAILVPAHPDGGRITATWGFAAYAAQVGR